MQHIASSRAGALAFLTAAVTLLTQILVHRIVSAKVLNNFAFLVISLSMLGFALAGVILSRWLNRFLENRDEVLSTSAALFALTILGACALFYRMDAGLQYVSFNQDFLFQFGR
jgi:Ni/Fe-hydrogenase subunit HybB-like protein